MIICWFTTNEKFSFFPGKKKVFQNVKDDRHKHGRCIYRTQQDSIATTEGYQTF